MWIILKVLMVFIDALCIAAIIVIGVFYVCVLLDLFPDPKG